MNEQMKYKKKKTRMVCYLFADCSKKIGALAPNLMSSVPPCIIAARINAEYAQKNIHIHFLLFFHLSPNVREHSRPSPTSLSWLAAEQFGHLQRIRSTHRTRLRKWEWTDEKLQIKCDVRLNVAQERSKMNGIRIPETTHRKPQPMKTNKNETKLFVKTRPKGAH